MSHHNDDCKKMSCHCPEGKSGKHMSNCQCKQENDHSGSNGSKYYQKDDSRGNDYRREEGEKKSHHGSDEDGHRSGREESGSKKMSNNPWDKNSKK